MASGQQESTGRLNVNWSPTGWPRGFTAPLRYEKTRSFPGAMALRGPEMNSGGLKSTA